MSAAAAEPRCAWGFVARFRAGDAAAAGAALERFAATGARHLRVPLAPGDAAGDWLDWLLPRLAARFETLPAVAAGEPALLEAVLWALPGPSSGCVVELRLASAADRAALPAAVERLRASGVRAVLGLPPGFDLATLPDDLSGVAALLAGAPAPEGDRLGDQLVERLGRFRAAAARRNSAAEVWLAGNPRAAAPRDAAGEVAGFLATLAAPADRIYCAAPRGLPQAGTGAASGEDGPPGLLARLLAAGGVTRVAGVARLAAPRTLRPVRPLVITGGSGFIGSNLADSFLAEGREVVVMDSLSRPGVEENLAWLAERHGARLHPALADLRDAGALAAAAADAAAVIHLAAQTAVTTSLADPVDDFEVNARGTLSLLEAVRSTGRRIPVIFASTNKVYGALDDLAMTETEDRYVPADPEVRAHGVGESRPLDFCTPYGCSKGVADQYVLDYARSFGVPSAVLRMSCIYGPRQFGTEDQGWVAHFLIRALRGEPISIYGDGKQVRDILDVADAVAAYRQVLGGIDRLSGRAFNLGGGPRNAVSLLAVLREIERLAGGGVAVRHETWRQGDQLFFVADTRRLEAETGWAPRVGWRDGLARLAEWLRVNRGLGAALTVPERASA